MKKLIVLTLTFLALLLQVNAQESNDCLVLENTSDQRVIITVTFKQITGVDSYHFILDPIDKIEVTDHNAYEIVVRLSDYSDPDTMITKAYVWSKSSQITEDDTEIRIKKE